MEEGRPAFKGNEHNRCTRLCMRWQEGHCRFGDRCNFAHGAEQLRRPGGGPLGPGWPQGPLPGSHPAQGQQPVYAGGMQQRPQAQSDLWAQQGYPVPGPGGWTAYTDPSTGDSYYHNGLSGRTQWEKPPGFP